MSYRDRDDGGSHWDEDDFINSLVHRAWLHQTLSTSCGGFDREKHRTTGENYLSNTTVTIVLIGECTKARKYVDWEIASTLRNDPGLQRPEWPLGGWSALGIKEPALHEERK